MKRDYKAISRYFTAVICLLALMFIFAPYKAAYAQGRLSAPVSKLWLNGTGTVEITVTDRAEGEDITATAYRSSYVKIEKGEWNGDTCTLTLTPRRTKTTTLTVSFGDETIKIKLYMTKEKEMTAEEVYSYARKACVEIKTWDSQNSVYIGTGFFVGNGLVLTNYHVVSSASKLTVTDYDGKEYRVKSICGYDYNKDMILIKVSATNTKALVTAKDATGGERAYSFGSPVGLTGSFSSGIVSNPEPKFAENDENFREGMHYIQISMPSGIGSGGGPILDGNGRVMGVMTLVVPAAQNLCFALDYTTINSFLAELTPDMAMSMTKFYRENRGKIKESNDYQIVTASDPANTASMYSENFEELTPEEIREQSYNAMAEVYVHYDAVYLVGEGEEPDYFNGSGFFISEDSVVTNNHVIAGDVLEIWVQDYSGRKYKVESIKKSDKYDLAILKVSCEEGLDKHDCLEVWTGYTPACGETVYCFGSPLGYTATFSEGTVRMSTRVFEEVEFINFSTPIYSGSSGGAMINKYGKVIAIPTRLVLNVENDNLAVKAKYLNYVEEAL